MYNLCTQDHYGKLYHQLLGRNKKISAIKIGEGQRKAFMAYFYVGLKCMGDYYHNIYGGYDLEDHWGIMSRGGDDIACQFFGRKSE